MYAIFLVIFCCLASLLARNFSDGHVAQTFQMMITLKLSSDRAGSHRYLFTVISTVRMMATHHHVGKVL